MKISNGCDIINKGGLMTTIEICIGVIVPIVSSILGGLFTFLGVRLTIKSDKKVHEESFFKEV